jgi:hypothetical protein
MAKTNKTNRFIHSFRSNHPCRFLLDDASTLGKPSFPVTIIQLPERADGMVDQFASSAEP